MSLQFIFGPSGAGKSYQSYKNLIEESMENPRVQYIILVPEQFTLQTQKDFVNMHPNKGILNIDVLSFNRLAYRIFEETGEGNLQVLDDEGKNLILRKIAKNKNAELQVLQGNMKKLGYITEVKSVISELVQYDLTPEVLESFLEQMEEKTALYYKLQDILVLYREYTRYLKDRYMTKEDMMELLARAIPKSKLLKDCVILMDGFTGFTPVQLHAVEELLKVCKEMRVTVTLARGENPCHFTHGHQVFALSKQMVSDLTTLAKDTRREIEESICINEAPVYRFRENTELAHLEDNIFRIKWSAYEKKVEKLGICLAQNPKKEAYEAAATVRAYVREHGCRYRDVGVIVSNMDTYGRYLEEAFKDFDIPLFMDYKRNILQNPFVEYVRSVLNLADQDFSYLSVFRFLRTNLSSFTNREVDLLENYCLARGIRGYKKWNEQWNFHSDKQTQEELAEINALRERLVALVDDLMQILKKRHKSIREITEGLYYFIVKEEFYQKLEDRAKMFDEKGEKALAIEHSQIYQILLQLFDKLVDLLGEEPVSIREYSELFDAGLEEMKVGIIPPGVDQVMVGDVERTRLKDIKLLLFLGANDTELPGNLNRNGLLSENDRKEFAKRKVALAPCGKERIYTQKFYLYSNLTKPSDALYVFYSRTSMDGKSVRPAYLIGELKKLFPELKERLLEEKALDQEEMTPAIGFMHLLEGFRNRKEEVDDAVKELYNWYISHPEWELQVDQMLQAGFELPLTHPLTKELAKALYGENFRESISRMEKFYTCAYAHFLTYGLRLGEREEFEFQALDLGNICHRALEIYGKSLKEKELSWLTITDEEENEWIEKSVEMAVSESGKTVLYSSARNEQMIERINGMMKRTVWAIRKQLSKGDFEPARFEQAFPNGKIDRIDLCEDGNDLFVKIMDYKTGAKSFDPVQLYYGLQLQLMVYMSEALKQEKKLHKDKNVLPAGAFYYQISDPIVDKPENIEGQMLKTLRPTGLVVDDPQAVSHLDHSGDKDSIAAHITYNKNGGFNRYSQVYAKEDFDGMMHHATEKVSEAAAQIKAGNVSKNPYSDGKNSGCDYCPYRGVCGFDPKEPGYKYNELEKIEKETALGKMREELENGNILDE